MHCNDRIVNYLNRFAKALKQCMAFKINYANIINVVDGIYEHTLYKKRFKSVIRIPIEIGACFHKMYMIK